MDRKEIVKILGEYFEITPKYLGAPSFAYEIEIKDEIYTIGRYGNITTQDGRELILEDIINPNQEQEKETIEAPSIERAELSISMEGHSGATLKNIVNILSSKQHLIKKSIGLNDLIMDETFAEDLSHKQTGTLEELKIALEELGKEICKGLIFDFENNMYTYVGLNYEKITTFAVLATLINESAMKQKHASYKPVQDDNPKYAFRTWLIRLGMKGSGYKDVRKVLLENLEGNGAFRKIEERGDVN